MIILKTSARDRSQMALIASGPSGALMTSDDVSSVAVVLYW